MMNIYNISAKESFVDVLAKHFLDRYGKKPEELSRILFLLPNRRACQNLADAFVKMHDGKAVMLPRMEPLADIEEDEIFLSGNGDILQKLKPSIDNMERVLTFTRMIMHKNKYGIDDVSLAQAYSLAENLATLIDKVHSEELNIEKLKTIVPRVYSDYWDKTRKLLEIIMEYWPQILAERGLCDSVQRKKMLLKAELDYWQNLANRPKIVIAGTTAAFPYLKEAVKTVAEFDNGEVYLYGLDKYSDDEIWSNIDVNHPQFELKELLEYLNISRDSIPDLNTNPVSVREKLISEIMRPAATTEKWRNLSPEMFPQKEFDNIKLINCDDVRQEAATIALILRSTLETKEKTAALVTSDRNLSRRVISELKRWDINADDSAGQPLSLTPIGIYFRLIGEAVEQDTMSAVMAVMKYPFTACGMPRGDFIKKAYALEKTLRKEYDLTEEQQTLLDEFERRLQPLKELYENPQVDLHQMLITHIKVAESLADTDTKSGGKIIWKKDDGRAAAAFFADFVNKSENIEQIFTNDYLPFLTTVMTEQNVRMRYGYHPRIKILGPIEARLCNYDTVIIGEVNEGIWPKLPPEDMWMSRSMKKDFEMAPAERSIGVCAADFAHLMNAPKVYLTRAQKIDGEPGNKSRWWMRFETVLGAIFGDKNPEKKEEKDIKEYYAFIYRQPFSPWAKNLERCDNPQPVDPPCPKPKLKYRPRELSASKIEILMRDPYSIYARYILNLKPLNPLDREKQAFDFGTIVHKVLEEFNNKYSGSDYPEDALEQLITAGLDKFSGIDEKTMAFWKPKLEEIMNMVVNNERNYRNTVKKVHNEVHGEITFKGKEKPFVITCEADRVDETVSGGLNIIDYKTGHAGSTKELEEVTAPQLPVEALIGQEKGFIEKEGGGKISARHVESMQYWSTDEKPGKLDGEKCQKSITKIRDAIQELIDIFDDENNPYLSKSERGPKGQYDAYEHLSRFAEWATKDDNGSGD